ncbi:MAG: hypothetical protein M3463_06740 [Verrucomicrobiota bacterium]|nr:hypothetical protein [Verrucomicrobiota bacterium]
MKIRTWPHPGMIIGLTLAIAPLASAQTAVTESTTTTTTSAGTITEFSPDTLVIRSEGAASPVRYRYSKTTTYVDETGAPVSMETVKSGLPVTVHYVKQGNDMVASRVIVRKKTTTSAPAVEQKKTTTTTTTTPK